MQARLADEVEVVRWGIDWLKRLERHEMVGMSLHPDTEDATELEAHPIVGRNPDVGVEIEAVELRLARAAGGDVGEVRLAAGAAQAGGRAPI
jgi:hypothetical protein